MDERRMLLERHPWLGDVEARLNIVLKRIPRDSTRLETVCYASDIMRRLVIVALRMEHPEWTIDWILREILQWDRVEVPSNFCLGSAYEGTFGVAGGG
ncbi:MAG TPA: hypothetical protein VM008_09240 [Phycisphaerae bacterium]|nr:hypothetical protein [Phycisphaerae bacterium]